MKSITAGRVLAEAIAHVLSLDGRHPLDMGTWLDHVTASPYGQFLAGFAWRAVGRRADKRLPQIRKLRALVDGLAMQALCRERETRALASLLAENKIDAILCKGWSVARLYDDSGLRPYGDVDWCVQPELCERAIEVLTACRNGAAIDLHRGCPDLADRPWETVWQRSIVATLDGVPIRLFSAEDQLRQLALHFWRHEGERPFWLVDIVMALKSLPADFDWDYFFSGDPRWTERAVLVLQLARDLFGAALPELPARWKLPLPPWLCPAMFWRWGRGHEQTWRQAAREPAELLHKMLYQKWNPLRYSMRYALPSTWGSLGIHGASLPQRVQQFLFQPRRRLRPPPPHRQHLIVHGDLV